MTAMLRPAPEDDPLVPYDQARVELGNVSRRTIARYAQSGRLTRVVLGRTAYVTRSSLDRYKEQVIREAEAEAQRTVRALRRRG